MSDSTEQLSVLQQVERDEINRAFRDVVATEAGKRVVFWMLEQCAIYQDAFSGDPHVTNYQLGRQASGRLLISKLDELDPRVYPRLLIDMAEIREVDRALADAMAQGMEQEDEE